MHIFIFIFILGSAKPSTLAMELASPGGLKPAPKLEKALPMKQLYVEQLLQIPQFASFGPLFKSSQSQPLTESETEYIVHCIKHIFSGHVVFQVSKTLE
jgi:coatomer subunit gamma